MQGEVIAFKNPKETGRSFHKYATSLRQEVFCEFAGDLGSGFFVLRTDIAFMERIEI